MLIAEHISSPELRDFQENHKDWLKIQRANLKDAKRELCEKQAELAEENKTEAPENDQKRNFYKSSRIEMAQKQKRVEKIQKQIDYLENEIAEYDSSVNELDANSGGIVRIESLGLDRHRRTHWHFDNLPIFLEQPTNILQSGQIMATTWFVVESGKEYCELAEKKMSEIGLRESVLRKKISNLKASIIENYSSLDNEVEDEKMDDTIEEMYESRGEVLSKLTALLERVERNGQVCLHSVGQDADIFPDSMRKF